MSCSRTFLNVQLSTKSFAVFLRSESSIFGKRPIPAVVRITRLLIFSFQLLMSSSSEANSSGRSFIRSFALFATALAAPATALKLGFFALKPNSSSKFKAARRAKARDLSPESCRDRKLLYSSSFRLNVSRPTQSL